MNPDGSLGPGIMNFATMPAKKPMMIVQMIPIGPSPKRENTLQRAIVNRYPKPANAPAAPDTMFYGRLKRLRRLFHGACIRLPTSR
jgi:hypothetical protein